MSEPTSWYTNVGVTTVLGFPPLADFELPTEVGDRFVATGHFERLARAPGAPPPPDPDPDPEPEPEE